MSFFCTLHPVDGRMVTSLTAGVLKGRANWSVFRRLWKKKQLLDKVNQPFKASLAELLEGNPELIPGLHLSGRPFLIKTNDPEEIIRQINSYYGAVNEQEVLTLFLAELEQISLQAYLERKNFEIPRRQRIGHGISAVVFRLHQLYKTAKFKELGEEIGFVLAQLLGYAYPYWRVDEGGLTLLKSLELPGWDWDPDGLPSLFQGLPVLEAFLPRRLERSLAAGIYLSPVQVRELLTMADTHEEEWLNRMGAKQLRTYDSVLMLQKIKEALTYAQEYSFGLLEASDIFENDRVKYP